MPAGAQALGGGEDQHYVSQADDVFLVTEGSVWEVHQGLGRVWCDWVYQIETYSGRVQLLFAKGQMLELLQDVQPPAAASSRTSMGPEQLGQPEFASRL